jgi:hypothetical protein
MSANSRAVRASQARRLKIIIAGVAIAVALLSIARVTGFIGPRPAPEAPSPTLIDAHNEQTRRAADDEGRALPAGEP